MVTLAILRCSICLSFLIILANSKSASIEWCDKNERNTKNLWAGVLRNIYPFRLRDEYIVSTSKNISTFPQCVEECCKNDRCNVAFMFSKMCYSFGCDTFLETSCQPLKKEEDVEEEEEEEENEDTYWITVRNVEVSDPETELDGLANEPSIFARTAIATPAMTKNVPSTVKSVLITVATLMTSDTTTSTPDTLSTIFSIQPVFVHYNEDENTIENTKNDNNTSNKNSSHNHKPICTLECSGHGVCEREEADGKGVGGVTFCQCETAYLQNPFSHHPNCDWKLVNVIFCLIIIGLLFLLVFSCIVHRFMKGRKRLDNPYNAMKPYRRSRTPGKENRVFYGRYIDDDDDDNDDDDDDDDDDEEEILVRKHLEEMINSEKILMNNDGNGLQRMGGVDIKNGSSSMEELKKSRESFKKNNGKGNKLDFGVSYVKKKSLSSPVGVGVAVKNNKYLNKKIIFDDR